LKLTCTNKTSTLQDMLPSTTNTFPCQDKTHRLKEMLNRNRLILLTKSQADTHNMPKTNGPSGNWGEKQKEDLRRLIDLNEADYTRRDAAYLWAICQLKPFQPFISAANRKNSAIQRMQKEFLRHKAGLEQKGARKKGMLFLLSHRAQMFPHSHIMLLSRCDCRNSYRAYGRNPTSRRRNAEVTCWHHCPE
jgi:hypothetical protein